MPFLGGLASACATYSSPITSAIDLRQPNQTGGRMNTLDPRNFEDFLQELEKGGLPSTTEPVPIGDVLEQNSAFASMARKWDLCEAASTFGGLLLAPQLQSCCIRLEGLVHAAIGYARGRKSVHRNQVKKAFAGLHNTTHGLLEDPAEDLFVSLVYGRWGNFRIFEGIWEGNGFILQRFVNIVETFPDAEPFNSIQSSMLALLRLSDAIASRRELARYVAGEERRLRNIPPEVLDDLPSLSRAVQFTDTELRGVGIELEALSDFILPSEEYTNMLGERFGNSKLERRPLLYMDGRLIAALPTAIGLALRLQVIERLMEAGFANQLEEVLAKEYGRLFGDTHLFGDIPHAPLYFQNEGGVRVGEFLVQVDEWCMLHFIAVVDGFSGYENGAMSSRSQVPYTVFDSRLKSAARYVKEKHPDMRCITVAAMCGWGRAIMVTNTENLEEPWRVEGVSAAQVVVLSESHGVTPLTLWRLFDAVEKLKERRVDIQNINGLLNLYAWARSQDHHLFPHRQVRHEDMSSGRGIVIAITQNGLRALREEVAIGLDDHTVADSTGVVRFVRRKNQHSYFQEDKLVPLYVSWGELSHGTLRAVYESNQVRWWCVLEVAEGCNRDLPYRIWEAACEWLVVTAPIVEAQWNLSGINDVTWHLNVADIKLPDHEVFGTVHTIDSLRAVLEVSTSHQQRLIEMTLNEDFMGGFHHPENIAERCMVESLVRAIAELEHLDINDAEITSIVTQIVPDTRARHLHFFTAQTFRDYVRHTLPEHPVAIDPADNALLRLGLAWMVPDGRGKTGFIGEKECSTFLNKLAEALCDALRKLLRGLDRTSTLIALAENRESIAADRNRWSHTIGAVRSLRQDPELAEKNAAEQLFRLNAAEVGSRIAMEIAICECCRSGGKKPGKLELGRLMAISSLLFELGGVSDAIHYGVLTPQLGITAMGDVVYDHSFYDTVLEPFGHIIASRQLGKNSRNYAESFTPPPLGVKAAKVIEDDFAHAWLEEFGFAIDEGREFVDYIEDLGIQHNCAVLMLSKDEMRAHIMSNAPELAGDVLDRILERLSLPDRLDWETVPDGFRLLDILPWRYRRRLSAVSRPILRLTDQGGIKYLIEVGSVRESLLYLLSRSHYGEFDEDYFTTTSMRQWVGRQRARTGLAFNEDVAKWLESLGWYTKPNLKLSEILNRKMDRDYGDVDVLAWRESDGRVLVIECKSLAFAKTQGEIAKQVSEFRGEYNSKGKPDRLLRHLDRVDVLKSEVEQIRRYAKLRSVNTVEAHVVFRNPVPMWRTPTPAMASIGVHIYEDDTEL